MSIMYAYHYAIIDLETGWCYAVQTTTEEVTTEPDYIPIPVYDEEYCLKYYINGNWYEDPDGTIPWTSSLL